MPKIEETTAEAIGGAFISPNESDRNLEPANVVDGLFAIAREIGKVSRSLGMIAAEMAATRDPNDDRDPREDL